MSVRRGNNPVDTPLVVSRFAFELLSPRERREAQELVSKGKIVIVDCRPTEVSA